MVRITTEEFDDCMFVNANGNVLDITITPYVLLPDPKALRSGGPCQF